MRFTDKAAEASLHTPEGLSPSVIGKVVTIKVIKKKDDYLHAETLTKFVGVLETYILLSYGVEFKLAGGKLETVNYQNASVECTPLKSS